MKKSTRRIVLLSLVLVLVCSLTSTAFALTWGDDEPYDNDRYIVSWFLTLNTRSVSATLDVFDDVAGEYITNEATTSLTMTHQYYPADGSALRTVTTNGVYNTTRKMMGASVSYTASQAYRIRYASATYRTTVPASYGTQHFTATSPVLEQ